MESQEICKLTTNITSGSVHESIRDYLLKLLFRQKDFNKRSLIFLCIGSDRYTGDSLGPLIGSYLEEHTACTVYGSLDYPVHAGNLVETIRFIEKYYEQPIIIAIDACLGKTDEVGNIEIWQGGLEAGIAVGNPLPSVGNVSIIGVVNACGEVGYQDLQNTPLSIVVKLSKIIGKALTDVMECIGYS